MSESARRNMSKPLNMNEEHSLDGFPDLCILLAGRLNPYDPCRAEDTSPLQGARDAHHMCGIPVDTEKNSAKILIHFNGTGR
jgi:hypothetical protein